MAPGRTVLVCAIAALALGWASACGGSSTPNTAPSPGGNSPTITITAAGVSPKVITVTQGAQVLFINNDGKAHWMYSDPHPEHTDCPPINQVGALDPGQQRQTGNLNTVRTCGYHDHEDAANRLWQGSIVIQ
jgi:plastocyanin